MNPRKASNVERAGRHNTKRRSRRISGEEPHGPFRPEPAFSVAGNDCGERAQSDRISCARRRAMEEICRHHHRSQSDQGAARRAAAKICFGVYRSHRHQGRVGSHSGTAATAEGGHRADVRQAELRRRSRQLSRAEAAIRQGRLARGSHAVHERPEPHRAGPHGRRFFRRWTAIRQERKGRDAFAALVGRLLHPVLEQGTLRQERASQCRKPSTRWLPPPRS